VHLLVYKAVIKMKLATAKTMTLFAKKVKNEMCTLVFLQYDRYIFLFSPRGRANVSIVTIDYFLY
jgi:hypothetical protein